MSILFLKFSKKDFYSSEESDFDFVETDRSRSYLTDTPSLIVSQYALGHALGNNTLLKKSVYRISH